MPPIKHVEVGQLLTAAWLDSLVDAINSGNAIQANGRVRTGFDSQGNQLTVDEAQELWLMQSISDTVDYDSSLTSDTIRAFVAQRVIANSDGTYSLYNDEKFTVYDPLRLITIFDDDADTTHAIPYQQFWCAVSRESGNREVVSVQARKRWLKCTSKWKYNGNSWSLPFQVAGHPCDDSAGTNVDTNTTLTVYFNPSCATATSPNTAINDIIPYEPAGNGSNTGVNPMLLATAGYLFSDNVGAIRFDMLVSGSAPRGWAIMNGTDNSVANGGSGIDLVTNNPFLRTSSGTGGSTFQGGSGTTYNAYSLVPIERLNNGVAA